MQKKNFCHLTPDNHQQLISFFKLLKEPMMKYKIDYIKLSRMYSKGVLWFLKTKILRVIDKDKNIKRNPNLEKVDPKLR